MMNRIPKKYICSRCEGDLRKEKKEGGCICDRKDSYGVHTTNPKKKLTEDYRNDDSLDHSYYSYIKTKAEQS